MSDERLKPCPFCGGEAKWANVLHNYIECKECDFETIWYDTEEKAIKIWNTRKPMERIVERLKNELELADKEKERSARENPLQFDSVKGYATGIYNAIEIVKEVAQAEPVTAEWVVKIVGKPESGGTLGKFTCSWCQKSTWATATNGDLNYCPNCGKKMKGAKDESV